MKDFVREQIDDLITKIDEIIGLTEFEVRQRQADALIVAVDGQGFKISIWPCRTRPTRAELIRRYEPGIEQED